MNVFFLQAKEQLVKHFQRVGTEIKISPYPLVSRFTSHQFQISTLQDFYLVLCAQAALGHALIKGKLQKSLQNESRAGATLSSEPTSWLLIDIDGLIGYTAESFMLLLAPNLSYIVQYSASSGVFTDKGLSCHIIILLDASVNPAILKEWLISLNLTFFKEKIRLNRLNESLHWPVDVTTCQNDKIIYIAPPICTPPEIDTFTQPRIELIEKLQSFFSFPLSFTPIPASEVEKLKNELRTQKGLTRSSKLRLDKSTKLMYSPNPQAAQITGVKEGTDFIHLNLNGGDSWGYYHLVNRPEIIYNFKGEPNYKTNELLPEYWDQLQKAKLHDRTKNKTSDQIVLAIRDRQSSTYYTGYYDKASKELSNFHPAASKEHVFDFLTNNGIPLPDSIADWSCTYNPHSFTALDFTTASINWFKPSPYMLQPLPTAPQSLPAPMQILFSCVLGQEQGLLDHFINWLNCIVRLRCTVGTAQILQGLPGTGKGLLINRVIRPLLGNTNVAIKRMSELHDKFNQHLENTLLCFVDEVQIGENAEHDKILADLKQFITEPTITIRKMRQAAYEAPNHTNWIFSSNSKQHVSIEQDDRRYTVGEYGRTPLRDLLPDHDTYRFVEALDAALPRFMDYLNSLEPNLVRASSVYANEARQVVMENSMATIDVVIKAIKTGNIEKLYEYVSAPDKVAEPVRATMAAKYYELFKDLANKQRSYLTRDELALICDCVVGIGNTPRGAAKFTQYLAHHDLRIKPVRANNKIVRGIPTAWVWPQEILDDLLDTSPKIVAIKSK